MTKTSDYVTRKDLREELTTFRDEIMTGLDKVMKELEEMREDSALGVYQTREIREQVDIHEKRITKLEAA